MEQRRAPHERMDKNASRQRTCPALHPVYRPSTQACTPVLRTPDPVAKAGLACATARAGDCRLAVLIRVAVALGGRAAGNRSGKDIVRVTPVLGWGTGVGDGDGEVCRNPRRRTV